MAGGGSSAAGDGNGAGAADCVGSWRGSTRAGASKKARRGRESSLARVALTRASSSSSRHRGRVVTHRSGTSRAGRFAGPEVPEPSSNLVSAVPFERRRRSRSSRIRPATSPSFDGFGSPVSAGSSPKRSGGFREFGRDGDDGYGMV